MTNFNIVEYIEKNPVVNLSNACQNRLVAKVKECFTDEEQQMFIASFYAFLKYDKDKDFVIDLDNIWKWLGFNQKEGTKRVLEKNFILDKDYIISAPPTGGTKTGRGGHNKTTILMTVKTFKKLCLKADTKKADQIHDYYVNLEEIIHQVINEESNELKAQLENQTNNIQSEKELLREKTILEQIPDNTQCIYYGIIDNKGPNDETLIKFGNSNFLSERVDQHKKTYTNFRLVNAFKVDNKTQVENAIKTHSFLSKLRVPIKVNGVNHVELLNINQLSFGELDKIIKEIIVNIEYNPENYRKLLSEHQKLKKKYKLLESKLKNTINDKPVVIYDDTNVKNENLLLTEENEKLKLENVRLIRKCKLYVSTENDDLNIENIVVPDGVYNNISTSIKKVIRNVDGFYYIDGRRYNKYIGTREDVWSGFAYKTSGGLNKTELLVNKHGDIISKKKFVYEKQHNRLGEVNKIKQANAKKHDVLNS